MYDLMEDYTMTAIRSAMWIVAAVLVCCLAIALLVWWLWPEPTPAEIGVSTQLPSADKIVADVEIIDLRPKKPLRAYAPKAKSDLNLPATVQADQAKHVIATGRLDAEERPYTLSAVLDEETGQSQVYARPEPLPWFAPSRHGALGVAYGIKPGVGQVGRLYGRQDLVRSKAFVAGLQGNVDTDGDAFAGLSIEWRW